MRGTGTAVPWSARMTVNSRSIACADGSSLATGPGLARITYVRCGVVSLYVGLDWPPLNISTDSGPRKPSTFFSSQAVSAPVSKACLSETGRVPTKCS